jgi:hypothetical protein
MSSRPFTKLACMGIAFPAPWKPSRSPSASSAPFTKLACMSNAGSDRPFRPEIPKPGIIEKLGLLVRKMPRDATGRDLVAFLNSAYELTAQGGFRVTSSTTARSRDALNQAINNPASIGIRSMSDKYPPGTRPRAEALRLATVAVGDASGDVVSTSVKVQAIKEIPRDVLDNVVDLGPYAAAAGVLGLGILAAVLLKK